MQTLVIGQGCGGLFRTTRRRVSVQANQKEPKGQAPQGPHCPTPVIKASRIPTPDEDREVAHTAFLHAFQHAQPENVRIHGMQEFASALLARSRIPSQQYTDPLMHIFDEFDVDKNGALNAVEVAAALQSRGVGIAPEQAQMFIEAVDLNSSHMVERSEFRDLILHMAAADLHSRRKAKEQGAPQAQQAQQSWDRQSWEEDEEIQKRLQSWVGTLLKRQKQQQKQTQ